MITICSRWETLQMPFELEWQMWRQMRGAFHIRRFVFTPVMPGFEHVGILDQFPTMEEALESINGTKVFLEPQGVLRLDEVDLADMQDPEREFAIVLGNTSQDNLRLVENHGGISCRIETPGRTDLYGINAAAIALSHWYGR